MAITPITDAQVSAVNVQSVSGDTLTGTVQENKAVFDRYPDLIKEKLNALINEYNNVGTTIQNSVVTIGTAPEGYNPLATNTLRMLFHYQNGNNENFNSRLTAEETATTSANSRVTTLETDLGSLGDRVTTAEGTIGRITARLNTAESQLSQTSSTAYTARETAMSALNTANQKVSKTDLYLDAATIAAFDWEIGGDDDSGVADVQ